jgi:hypothetical protein
VSAEIATVQFISLGTRGNPQTFSQLGLLGMMIY